MELPNEKLIEVYKKMLLVRTMEEKWAQLLAGGKIHLHAHLGTGQEAVSIGVTAPLSKDDILFGTHRGVGEYIGKGMRPRDIWAEYLGKRTGLCKGKGTLHLADRTQNIPGLVASLGSDFPIAVGTALASKMQNKNCVTMYFVGEGTCNQSDAHPSMCMAALWQLPIVFAVCTNQFCEMSYMSEHCPTEDIAPRAAGYGIPYEIVDGQDIETTYKATEKAVKHARDGKGPYLVEYKTFRMGAHFIGERAEYVKREDLEKWAKRDPIDLCRKKLLEKKVITSAQDNKLWAEVREEVDMAVETALSDPDPTTEDFITDIYEQKGVL
ncbi:MAG: thiamine pyrophosphate-dependent dehydrogenase E1 component subunit alpha [Syntrophorhabdaceae bacterium]|nr:thiamine pyrophosphate-dependent dehydrogenase E1 component subunit alpha [Syntrophorhabdaceae bacterium]MDD5242848.1 thiamine pyrophosphate-dependent dehydrogenase E1 component subunit alpha [Syntrophorhabdaceae bacterium]